MKESNQTVEDEDITTLITLSVVHVGGCLNEANILLIINDWKEKRQITKGNWWTLHIFVITTKQKALYTQD